MYSRIVLPFIAGFIFILSACEKTKIQFGQQYVDNSYANIIFVDTLTPELSTVYYDSIPTSATGSVLAGNYSDNVFGKVTAKSFFSIAPPDLNYLRTNAAYDSLVLLLIPDRSYYGDTTAAATLSVFQLQDELAFPSGYTNFYNTTDFLTNPAPLGTATVRISPNRTDTVFVKLSDVKGQELFNLYKSQDNVMQSAGNFLNYFKGLKLSPATGMQAVYGFKDSVILRVHYHETNLYKENKHLDFNYYNDGKQFNQVKADRTGTPLAVFSAGSKEVISSATNNRAYVQTLTGLTAKVTFPTLRSLLFRPDYLKILKAELIIRPGNNSYNSITPLPPELDAISTDRANTAGTVEGTGTLVLDDLYNQNTYYTYDITTYLQKQILVTESNRNGLLIIPPSPAYFNRLNRIIIGDKFNSDMPIQLKLYYVSVNP